MASSYSPLKVELIGTGEQAGTWGTTTNTNLGTTLEEAITGRATATFPSDANYTLPYLDSNSAQVFRNLVLNVTSSGNLSATRDLIIPAIEKQYIVENNTSGSQSIRIKTAAGTGVTIPTGKIAHVYCDGTNTRFADDFVAITGGTILGLSSALPVTSGGTGLATATQGDIIYASASNTYVALPKNTTATRYLANTGTSNNPAWAQIDLSNGVTGDLPFANLAQGTALSVLGVTGNATADNASIAAASDHQVLRRSGTSLAFGALALNQTNAVTGALPVANGGTGAATLTANNVLLGNGTSAVQFVAPGTSGNVLASNGTTWTSSSTVSTTSLGVGTAASGTTGEIRATNNITAYYSDDRLKTRIGDITGALEKVKQLTGFYYEANETAQALGYEVKREVGISAQEVQKVQPEVVVPAPIDEKYLTVRYERLIPLLIEAIKELDNKVSKLTKEA